MKANMNLLAAMMVVGSTLGLKIPARSANPIPDHGDGYYSVTVDRDNIPIDYEFTHIDDLNFTRRGIEDLPLAQALPLSNKRAAANGVLCGGGLLNQADLINSELCISAAATAGATWSKNAWGYCKVSSVVSYVCNYQTQAVYGNTVGDFYDVVSDTCGPLNAGFYRCTQACGVNDFAVGRNVNGAEFCTAGFKG